MKNLLYIIAFALFLAFLTSCTAEELPENNHNIQLETVDPKTPIEEENIPPVVNVPPTKKP